MEAGSSRMVFVVGNSRSGTTMMGRILGAHPFVFTFGELHFFEQLWSPEDGARRLSRTGTEDLAARLLSIQRQGYLGRRKPERSRKEAGEIASSLGEAPTPAEVFGAFLLYEAARGGGSIPCDQTPRNVLYIGEILGLYPQARIVNMVRDPRNVLLSQKRKWKRRFLGARGIPLKEAFRSRVNYHPLTISKLWNASVSAAESFTSDDRVLTVRFEDVLSEPETEVRRVCEHVGISFEESMLEVPQVGSSSGTDKPERRGINRGRAESWLEGGLSPAEVFLCQRVSAAPMKRHGYSPVPVSPNPLRVACSVVSLPVKLVLALLFNLGRMRNIKETIRRRMA